MASKSKIEWTDATWNPWRGCTKVSTGCKFCYAERIDKRWGRDFSKIERASEKQFFAPLHLRKPSMIFTCSMSDFFHEDADGWRGDAWNTILSAQQHVYQILTKRPENIATRLPKQWNGGFKEHAKFTHTCPSSVWLGVSVENQEQADIRIPELLKVPAAVRFLSVEPLLERVDLECSIQKALGRNPVVHKNWGKDIHWVIVGGESGPGARPMHPDWARSIRDQCQAAGVPFFFKQWGEWMPAPTGDENSCGSPFPLSYATKNRIIIAKKDGSFSKDCIEKGDTLMVRVGKKRAGRLIDGRPWDEMPV